MRKGLIALLVATLLPFIIVGVVFAWAPDFITLHWKLLALHN